MLSSTGWKSWKGGARERGHARRANQGRGPAVRPGAGAHGGPRLRRELVRGDRGQEPGGVGEPAVVHRAHAADEEPGAQAEGPVSEPEQAGELRAVCRLPAAPVAVPVHLAKEAIIVIRLAAIISFVLAFIFYAWQVHHGVWTWTLFMLLGFVLATICGRWDRAL